MADRVLKFQNFYNLAQWGFSEDHYYRVDDSFLGTDLLNAASAYWDGRRRFMSNLVSLVTSRFSLLAVAPNGKFKSAHQVRFFTADNMGLSNVGRVADPVRSPWNGALITLTAGAGIYKRPSIFRGIPKDMMPNTYPPADPPFPNGALFTAFNQFAVSVLGPGSSTIPVPPLRGRFGLKTYDRVLYAAQAREVLDVDVVTNTNTLRYYIANPVPFPDWLNNGSWVYVSGMRDNCFKGLNGRAQVKSTALQTDGTLAVVLYKKWCCNRAPTVKVPGLIGPLNEIFSPYDASSGLTQNSPLVGVSFERPVKRDTGRPFGGTRGRSPSRCC